jgi:hypothetical protein
MAIKDKKNTSLVDAYNQTTTQPRDVTIGKVEVGGMIGTGRGIEAGGGVTITERGEPFQRDIREASGNNVTMKGSLSVGGEEKSDLTKNNDLSGSFGTGGSKSTFDFASSPYGDLELTKYLYESGLQNIFSDYQRNVQTLQQQEAQQLQQAYAVRELSKKYLGEYASNVGVGDVSGNLIDIYAQYASNLGDIEQNFAALEMNLTREYTMQRMDTFNRLLEAQYNLNVAQLDGVAADASQYVFTEYDRDVAAGLAYLDSQRDTMRPQDYDAVRGAYYQSQVDGALQNFASGNPYFGFSDLENKVQKTQDEYLREIQQWMEPNDFERIQEVIALQELMASNEGELDFGDPITNFDPTLYTANPNISLTSPVYEMGGSRFAVLDVPISNDDVVLDTGIPIETFSKTLDEAWTTQTGEDLSGLSEGDILQYKGFYIYKDFQWYRMENISKQEQNLGLGFYSQGSGAQLPPGFEIDFNYGRGNLDAVTVNGRTYVEDDDIGEYKDLMESSLNGVPMTQLIAHLNSTFDELGPRERPNTSEVSNNVTKGTIFEYRNRLYVYTADGNKIRPLVQETKTQE